jgi:hypothetical protein
MHIYCNETTKSNQFSTDRKRGVEKYRDLGNEKRTGRTPAVAGPTADLAELAGICRPRSHWSSPRDLERRCRPRVAATPAGEHTAADPGEISALDRDGRKRKENS